jgi:hypothetical protein
MASVPPTCTCNSLLLERLRGVRYCNKAEDSDGVANTLASCKRTASCLQQGDGILQWERLPLLHAVLCATQWHTAAGYAALCTASPMSHSVTAITILSLVAMAIHENHHGVMAVFHHARHGFCVTMVVCCPRMACVCTQTHACSWQQVGWVCCASRTGSSTVVSHILTPLMPEVCEVS